MVIFLKSTQAQLVTAGAPVENVMVARVDVTDRQAVYAATKQIESVLGHIQILVNNAGIVTGKKILDCPDELMEKTVQVNADKTLHACATHWIPPGQHNFSLLDSQSLPAPHDTDQQRSHCDHRKYCWARWSSRSR